MKKVELEKHKFDQRMKFAVFLALLIFAGFLQIVHSPLAGEIVALIVGLGGGNALANK